MRIATFVPPANTDCGIVADWILQFGAFPSAEQAQLELPLLSLFGSDTTAFSRKAGQRALPRLFLTQALIAVL